jgi:CubicO group peptidase (beta-lactamase class C family)
MHLSQFKIYLCLIAGFLLFGCSEDPTEPVSAPPVPADLGDGWAVASLSSVGINYEPVTWMSAAIKSGQYGNIDAVLIVRNGKLVFEEYYGIYNVNRLHDLASVTKSILSLLVGMAFDHGFLTDINQPVADFFPEYANIFDADSAKRKITIRHLLTMSSGLQWDEWSYSYTSSMNSYYQMQRSADWLKFVLQRPLINEPGSLFTYNSGGSMLLGAIIKNACDMYADQWAQILLFEPLAITAFQWDKNSAGLIHTGGGLHLRPRDLAKIGYLVLKRGKWNDVQLVSESWIDSSTAVSINIWPGVNYGFQWWLRELPEQEGFTSAPNDIIYGLGYAGQYLFIIPRLDMVMLVHSQNLGERESAPLIFLYNFIIPAIES